MSNEGAGWPAQREKGEGKARPEVERRSTHTNKEQTLALSRLFFFVLRALSLFLSASLSPIARCQKGRVAVGSAPPEAVARETQVPARREKQTAQGEERREGRASQDDREQGVAVCGTTVVCDCVRMCLCVYYVCVCVCL